MHVVSFAVELYQFSLPLLTSIPKYLVQSVEHDRSQDFASVFDYKNDMSANFVDGPVSPCITVVIPTQIFVTVSLLLLS